MNLHLSDIKYMCKHKDLSYKQFCALIHKLCKYSNNNEQQLNKITQLIISRMHTSFVPKDSLVTTIEQLLCNIHDKKHVKLAIATCLRTLYPKEKKYSFESHFDSDSDSDHSSFEQYTTQEDDDNSPLWNFDFQSS